MQKVNTYWGERTNLTSWMCSVYIWIKWPIQPEIIPDNSMKQWEESLLPPWMGCQSIGGNPLAFYRVSLIIWWYPFILLGWEWYCEREVFCPWTQYIYPGTSQTPTSPLGVQRINHWLSYCISLLDLTQNSQSCKYEK